MPRSVSRWASLLLFVTAAAVAGWLIWRCQYDNSIRFLPQHGPGAWIVYPNPPDILAHPILNRGEELTTVFRRSIILEHVSTNALMQVRALESFSIQINDHPVTPALQPDQNWKEISEISVSRWLVRGSNRIEITVTNRAGPPLLWLTLITSEQKWFTDASWQAECMGATWQFAQLATNPRPFRPGNPMHSDDGLISSFRRKAWTHGAMLLASVILVASARRASQRNSLTASETIKIALGGMAFLWVALFLNNLVQRAPLTGFDVTHHLAYIKYIQDWHELPRPGEGWEMHQAPLYYLFSALFLQLLGLSAQTLEGVITLRLISLCFGIGQIFLIFASLRLLFPNELRRPLIGAGLGAFLPAHLYHAHYITNETFLALLVSGGFYLCLRVLRSKDSNFFLWAGLGACVGAALLTKLSALIIAPVVFAALAAKLIAPGEASFKIWLQTLGASLAACLLVCGWYYWRLGLDTEGPFNDPSRWAYGSGWWQQDGYRTTGYYFRWGHSLVYPLYSGFHSFWDGLYSTLWGDGLCGGSTAVEFKPPWNYDLLAAGYVLALLPTLAVATGLLFAIWNLLRRPSPQWCLLVGAILLFGLALIYFSLVAPGTSQVRASFGLMLLVPFCAVFAWGMDRILSLPGWSGLMVMTITVWFALNSFFAHWIPASSTQSHLLRARELLQQGRLEEAADAAEKGVREDPSKAMLRSLLADSWNQLGRSNQSKKLIEQALVKWPDQPMSHLDAGFELMRAGQFDEAIAETRRARELAPDDPMASRQLVSLLARQKHFDQAVIACRDTLRITPNDQELQAWLRELQEGKVPAKSTGR